MYFRKLERRLKLPTPSGTSSLEKDHTFQSDIIAIGSIQYGHTMHQKNVPFQSSISTETSGTVSGSVSCTSGVSSFVHSSAFVSSCVASSFTFEAGLFLGASSGVPGM